MFEGSGVSTVDPAQPGGEMPLPIEHMDATGALESLRHARAQQAYWEARQIRLLKRMHELRTQDGTADYVGDEVAVFLHWAPQKGTEKVDQAVTMVERVPNVVDALEDGRIDYPKAHAIVDGTSTLEPE